MKIIWLILFIYQIKNLNENENENKNENENENKSHSVYIKDFNGFMCNKTKTKSKKFFCNCFFFVYSVLVVKEYW